MMEVRQAQGKQTVTASPKPETFVDYEYGDLKEIIVAVPSHFN